MNTTVKQIKEYIETNYLWAKTSYDLIIESDEYRDNLLKGMVDSLNQETESLEELNNIHELMGFINGFRLSWRMRELQRDEAVKTQAQMITEEQPA